MSDIGINNLSSTQPVGSPLPPPGDSSPLGNQPSIFARYTTYLADGYTYDKTLGDKMIGGDDAGIPRQAIGFVGKVAVVVGGAALRTTGIAALLSFAGSVLHSFAQWVIGKVVNYALDSAISEARKIADPNSDAPPEKKMAAGALIAVAEGNAADFTSALLETPDFKETRDLLIQNGIDSALVMLKQIAEPDSDADPLLKDIAAGAVAVSNGKTAEFAEELLNRPDVKKAKEVAIQDGIAMLKQIAEPDSDADPLLKDIAAGVVAVSNGKTDEFTKELLNRPDVKKAKEVAIQDGIDSAKDLVWQKASPYVPAAVVGTSLFVGGAVAAFVSDPESSVLQAVSYGVGAVAIGVGATSVCTKGYACFISARDSLFSLYSRPLETEDKSRQVHGEFARA